MAEEGEPRPKNKPTDSQRKSVSCVLAVAGFLVLYKLVGLDSTQVGSLWLNALLYMSVVWFPIVAMHECGHALAALALGFRVRRVTVGSGRPILDARWGPTRVTLCAFAGAGRTWIFPLSNDAKPARRRRLVTLAGPMTHAIPPLVALLAQGATIFSEGLLTLADGPAPLAVFLWGNLWFLVRSLVPSGHGATQTDGARLFRRTAATEDDVRLAAATEVALAVEDALDVGDPDKAESLCRKAMQELPESSLVALCLAGAMLAKGNIDAAIEALERLPAENWKDPEDARRWGALVANGLADAHLLQHTSEGLREADRLNRAALEQLPRTPALLGTRGAVLVSQGELRAGRRVLRRALRASSGPNARAGCACWLAVAWARDGNAREARRWLKRARKWCPWLHELAWVEEQVARSPVEDTLPGEGA